MFSEEVKKLTTFVEKSYVLPKNEGLLVCEIPPKTTTDERGRPQVDHRKLVAVEEYEQQFAELQKGGPAWINLSVAGLYKGFLIVSIELSSAPGKSVVRTSINYSGPSQGVVSNEWDVQQVLSIH